MASISTGSARARCAHYPRKGGRSPALTDPRGRAEVGPRRRLQDGNGLDFNHHSRKRERANLDCCGGWRSFCADELIPYAREVSELAHVGEIDSHLDNRVERRARLLEHRSQVLEREASLSLEVPGSLHFAVRRDGALSRDEDHGLGALHPPRMREPEPLLPRPWVDLVLFHWAPSAFETPILSWARQMRQRR